MNPLIFSILISLAIASNEKWRQGNLIVEGGIVCEIEDDYTPCKSNLVEKKKSPKEKKNGLKKMASEENKGKGKEGDGDGDGEGEEGK